MLWKEIGVCEDSYMCFFDPPRSFKEHFYFMVNCGLFHCNTKYKVSNRGVRPPIFFYIISESLHLEYEGSTYCAEKDSIVLLNCYHEHCYYCTENTEFLFFHFQGKDSLDFCDYLISENGTPVFNRTDNHDIYEIINEPIMRLCYQEQSSDVILSSLVYEVLCHLYHGDNAMSPVKNHTDTAIIEQSIQYIKNHVNEKITLQDLAGEVGLSPSYFSRLFKKEIGFAPIEYVAITKINFAKLMLRTTNSSISEIAETLGYSSDSSFINAFRLRRGMSPHSYRKMAMTRNVINK